MRAGTIAFGAGIVLLLGCRELPDSLYLQLLPGCLLAVVLAPRWRVPMLAVLGFLCALLHVAFTLRAGIPEQATGRDLRVEGIVASIPSKDPSRQRFVFVIDRFHAPAGGVTGLPRPLRARLDWYGHSPVLTAGERWRLTVRLKPPHGLMNPGGFDYETYLLRARIRATGYVRAGPTNTLLHKTHRYAIHRIRQQVLMDVSQRLVGLEHAGLVPALSVGVRGGLTETEWNVFRATGTAHLVAISGLHIGLVAGLVFWVVRRLWMLSAGATLRVPSTRVAALAAMVAALGYAALAGFSVPTERALVMTTVVLLGLFLRRAVMPSVSLSWALFGVLLVEPLAVLSVGFWLSFGAVSALLYAMTNRVGLTGNRFLQTALGWGRVQWAASLGLLPLMLLFFQSQPLVAPLANLVAVPWMSFVVVPLTLVGVGLSTLSTALSSIVMELALSAFEPLWHVLEWLARQRWEHEVYRDVTWWMVLSALTGTLILLAPRGFPGRWVGCLWLLPALFPGAHATLPHGAFGLTVLDVGQGLSVVVRTRSHVLIYDAGPRFGTNFDAGRSVIVPFLRAQGVGFVDAMVLSHAHSDHIGGAPSVLEHLTVGELYQGGAQRWPMGTSCQVGQGWRWDGVDFEFLHPPPGSRSTGNDASCVLRVAGSGGSALLPGDIEQPVEDALLRGATARLRCDILVAPHHGSGTSSSSGFLAAVQPRFLVFSTGYLNRFGFPHPAVLARARGSGAELFFTPRDGAIRFEVTPHGGVAPPRLAREQMRRPWHHRLDG